MNFKKNYGTDSKRSKNFMRKTHDIQHSAYNSTKTMHRANIAQVRVIAKVSAMHAY